MVKNSSRRTRRGPGAGRPQQGRPDHRPRGNGGQSAQRNYERYLSLAQDAASSGDRVTTEYYYQHADHYYRLMSKEPA